MRYVPFDITIVVEPSEYKTEPWYTATVKTGLAQWDAGRFVGHGRTPGRSAGFALEKLAQALITGEVKIEDEHLTAAAPERRVL